MSELKFGDKDSIRLRNSARNAAPGCKMTANGPTSSHWRKHAREVIRNVIAANKGEGYGKVRAAIKDAYPFGQRKYMPYKIWLQEIRLQCQFYGIGGGR